MILKKKCSWFQKSFQKVLHFIFSHDILINVADAETQKTTKKKLKNLVDIEK
ncbi:hypothetical protein ABH965_005594 [Bacillus sp. RC97]|uniref:hypothetical protein n=1 Tax=Bacillus sp. RC97 TaxID=3156294 RepID=UPI003838FFD1